MSSQIEFPTNADIRFRRGAKALILRGDRVLLTKERHSDGSVFWTLPGGGARQEETRTAALQRELYEELNCRAVIQGELTQFWYAHVSCDQTVSHCAVFDCTLISSASPNAREGIYDKQWARPDDLPPSTLPQVRFTIENWCGL